MATIGEHSASFEELDNEDSLATVEDLGNGEDREESTPPMEGRLSHARKRCCPRGTEELRSPSRETSQTNFRPWRGRMQLTTTGVTRKKRMNSRLRLHVVRTCRHFIS
ncbi:hypothetical protein JG687_00019447 [Phytophthora cactorum]|uniref:Uncharacterized protein n=1 Tax=Phytophthora cactorum TaxID=29920 RepID=A0A8T1TKL9_9STRA|nr:hypothetical protein JG687_00019447 [Phytophthora cactorum]